MKTKEAIAKEVAKASTPKDFHAKIDNAIVPWILEAMTVYAQQQAIAFAEHIHLNYSPHANEGEWYDHHIPTQKILPINTPDLYAQFIDSQKNIKTAQ